MLVKITWHADDEPQNSCNLFCSLVIKGECSLRIFLVFDQGLLVYTWWSRYNYKYGRLAMRIPHSHILFALNIRLSICNANSFLELIIIWVYNIKWLGRIKNLSI